jgi:hypothetical protein
MMALTLWGCEMKDADRCPNPWVYIQELRICCPQNYVYDRDHDSCKCKEGLVPGSDKVTCEKAPPVDTDPVDSGGTDSESEDNCTSGLGTPCLDSVESSDCAAFCEDFCAWNPVYKTGYCTTENCTDGACASGYKCCDCTQSSVLPKATVCLTTDDAGLASSLGGCTCEK